jgi:uncharacterized protein with PQ loop repeat
MATLPGTCELNDWRVDALTFFLCLGTVASYLPQHYRIIVNKSSEGFSPWFLLLGTTAALSNVLNLVIKQWSTLKCCRDVGPGTCLGLVGGVVLCTVVWACFSFILILYVVYYPPHLKYVTVEFSPVAGASPAHIQTNLRTDEWQLSVIIAWVVFFHMAFTTFVTFLLLVTGTQHQRNIWAGFLGMFAAASAVVQYAPQLLRTYRARLVGALSIPMMCIQTPGAVLMVISIAFRPDTNWTSWITFAVTGVLQGCLLVMCLRWRVEQRKLGLNDFGHILDEGGAPYPANEIAPATIHQILENSTPENGRGTRNERTPLLRIDTKVSDKSRKGFFGWLKVWSF